MHYIKNFMLLIFRLVTITTLIMIICFLGILFCSFRPRNPKNAQIFGRLFGRLAPLFGLRIIVRLPANVDSFGGSVYISNHQNNYDMVTVSSVIQPDTVTVGKKEILWIPVFGILYWLSGNILLDRSRRANAHNTLTQISTRMRTYNLSVWLFPEGTRSRGKGLMPFKIGAFHTAISAGVPIVPICVSNLNNKVKLTRWDNGEVIIEILNPIPTANYNKEQTRELAQYCHKLMLTKIEQLDNEVILREQSRVL